jgi:hypothetical protein
MLERLSNVMFRQVQMEDLETLAEQQREIMELRRQQLERDGIVYDEVLGKVAVKGESK